MNPKTDSPTEPHNPFHTFYQNPLYLEFKNHLYNYRLRREAITEALRKNKIQAGPILETGSGISTMLEGPSVVYTDLSFESALYLKENRSGNFVAVASVTHLPLKEETFSCVICSEVLEHVPDDQSALNEFWRVLKADGSLILTVPIHSRYYGFDDAMVRHVRRYDVIPFLKKIKASGFYVIETRKVTGFLDKIMMSLATRIYAWTSHSKGKSTQESRSLSSGWTHLIVNCYKWLNGFLGVIVRLEARVMPLATTAVLLIHCRKKTD